MNGIFTVDYFYVDSCGSKMNEQKKIIFKRYWKFSIEIFSIKTFSYGKHTEHIVDFSMD